jgi:hypothetical protein
MNRFLSVSVGERRLSLRQPRLNGAMIVFNGNSSAVVCVVRDLSPQGARLLVASPSGIPDQFDLRIDQTGVCHPSKVAWRSAHQIGVKFLDRG